ncbi:MAG: helix-turn-helix transcriptional regulator [Acidobacteriota bacterium]
MTNKQSVDRHASPPRLAPAVWSRRSVGRRLARLRRSRKWTQERVAAAVGVDRGTISRWERGVILPSVDRLGQLSRLFEIPFADLFAVAPKKSHSDPSEETK